jgi:hypothetical protein
MTEYYIKIAKQTIATWLSQHTARTGPVGWVRVVGGLDAKSVGWLVQVMVRDGSMEGDD